MSTSYKGYMGKVMKVDLTTQTVSEYPWSDKERRLFLGGKIMAAKIICDNITPDILPFSEKNMIVITTGPFTGSGCPSTSRFNMSTRSPQTGLLTSSNCGGNFGYFLKKAGYDALIITGKSESRVWLEIDNDKFIFHEADDLWGMKTGPVQEVLDEKLKELNNGKLPKNGKVVIGPAGENLVLYASVVSNERLAGRGGVGAIMGFKNLKAVTVTGNHTVEVYEPEKLKDLNKKWVKYLKRHPLTGDQLPRLGSAGLVSTMQMRNQLSTKNYNYGRYKDFEKVSGEVLAEEHHLGNKGCLTCPIRCARTVMVEGRPVKGPELETLGLLGGGILNNDIKAVLKWNFEIDELGMDTISAANTLAYAMEANEKGLWDNGLKFGPEDKEAQDKISDVFEDIAFRRGIGNELAEGSKRLSEKYGGKEFAIQSKGMELAAYEPRRSVGLGLGYAISNRGACHLNGGYMVLVEGLSLNVNQQTPHGKPDFAVIFQDLMESVSAAGQCLFTTYAFFPPPLIFHPNAWYTKAFCGAVPFMGPVLRLVNRIAPYLQINLPVIFNQSKALKMVTGMHSKFGTFLEIGKRGYTLERYVNTRFGVSAKDDTLPKRLTDDPQDPKDPTTKVPLEAMKKVYYKARGWDKNGIPTKRTLKKLKII